MAQRTTITLLDDLDGSEADETVEFALDGVDYKIDLSARNAGRLRDIFADYVQHGRRTGGRTTRRPATPRNGNGKASRKREEAAAMRNWARGQGIEVSDRGRIPEDVRRRYNARNQRGKKKSTARREPSVRP